jgi:CDGSH-type Zn-finger protein
VEQDPRNTKRSRRYRIKVTTDGPYLVSGGVPLLRQRVRLDPDGKPHGWTKGRRYSIQGDYALCRCGRSPEMPFCDGTHVRVGFDGTETAADVPYLDQAEELEGPDLRLTDAEAFCTRAGFCRRAGGTWALTRRSADPEARETAIEEACDCPSGRLVAWDRDGRPIEPAFEPSIVVVEESQPSKMGPLWVRGGIPVESSAGTVYEVRNRVTLCRCGRSANKPFCDGAHDE